MKKAFIIHGAYGNPSENWFPWLQNQLTDLGITTIVPTFPTPVGQSLNNWLDVFSPYIEQIDGDTMLVGHSIGATFVLRILEQIDHPIQAVYLVSGFINDLHDDTFDRINNSFYKDPFDWEKIKKNNIFYFYGSDDPYVPVKNAQEIVEKLDKQMIMIENGGHLNAQAGYTHFDLLLETIKANSL